MVWLNHTDINQLRVRPGEMRISAWYVHPRRLKASAHMSITPGYGSRTLKDNVFKDPKKLPGQISTSSQKTQIYLTTHSEKYNLDKRHYQLPIT